MAVLADAEWVLNIEKVRGQSIHLHLLKRTSESVQRHYLKLNILPPSSHSFILLHNYGRVFIFNMVNAMFGKKNIMPACTYFCQIIV
jgi:hypothetical protein